MFSFGFRNVKGRSRLSVNYFAGCSIRVVHAIAVTFCNTKEAPYVVLFAVSLEEGKSSSLYIEKQNSQACVKLDVDSQKQHPTSSSQFFEDGL